MPTLSLLAILTVLVSVSASPAHSLPRYAVTDLGLPPGAISATAVDVNASGTAVGTVTYLDGRTEAFVASGGSMHLLGWLPQGTHSSASAINDEGVVVGDSDTQHAEPRAVVWTAGTAASIRDLTNGNNGANVHTSDINSSGVVAGYFTRSGSGQANHWEAVTWTPPYNGDMVPLGPVPGSDPAVAFTIAEAINDEGIIAGWTLLNATSPEQGFTHGPAGYRLLGLTAVPGAQNSFAFGLNNAGDVVGYVDTSTWDGTKFVFATRAFLARGEAMSDLGMLPGDTSSQAVAINAHREIVGTGSSLLGATRGFVRLGGTMFDLNALIDPLAGYIMRTADAINERGQIAGAAELGGQRRPVLLTPIAGPASVTGLHVARDGANPTRVVLTWDQSCSALATDFAVYEGAATAFTNYESVLCSTGGSTSAVVAPAPGNRFFLVVPHDGALEGSYGQDSSQNERPRGTNACLPEANPNRCP